MAKKDFDVIVVGAGFGGSSCAGLLAKYGLNVLLLEKNNRAGGKAMSISKGGFTHTPWVVIGAPVEGNLYQVILDELGVADRAELVVPGNSASIYKNSTGKYLRMPQAESGVMDPNPVFDWLEIKEDEREEALRLFTELTLMSPDQTATWHGKSFDQWLSQYNTPRGLYAFLVSLCCDGMFMVPVDSLDAGEAIKGLQDMFLRSGGMFCKGGYGQVAEAYCEAVRQYGGRVIMNARAEKIVVEQGQITGVVTNKGSFKAPIVISNAGIQPTVVKLVGEEHFDKSYVIYVKGLIPSWSLLGYRYYLNKRVIDAPYGVIISNDSPWSLERFYKARAGETSREGVVYFEVPSVYDPDGTPEGKQVLMTGCYCPANPDMTKKEIMEWAEVGEKIIFEVFPEVEDAIDKKELYTTKSVSSLTRDSVVPGCGGETIGLGQIVGQCGPDKPSIKAPVQGLFIVGCDAGGTGVGTQQAIDSGMSVADAVRKYHLMHKATP
ncbi:MAG: NAD(P)/FAD-dependent oxidoreductase [Deltaproteobacteria bacterium]|nr:NAD(P)/FAD-dependent oxidoreductase [Deltaproteobacteria bacterium]